MNSSNTIYTFGDGFAHGHIWPEWPQILTALLPDYQIVNCSGVGAGNEFIFSNLVNKLIEHPDATYIVQWAGVKRFDKLIQDTSWDSIVQQDPVYSKNFRTIDAKTWWLSSASQLPQIQQYHSEYVQPKQAQLRTFNYIWAASQLLKHTQNYMFSSYKIPFLSNTQQALCQLHPSMFSFSQLPELAKFCTSEIQPHPIVHLEWIRQILLPALQLNVDPDWLDTITKRMYNQNWMPYDVDRASIWANIVDSQGSR
jgi:hypothetical protein